MKPLNRTLATAVLTGTISVAAATFVHAEETNNERSVKPLEGLAFHIGTKDAVGYFYNKANKCKLVLTIADKPIMDVVQTFVTVRYEADVPSGKLTRYNPKEGKSFEFSCATDAQTMTMKEVERVASGTAD